MSSYDYWMENEDEAVRLDIKIDEHQIKEQAKWAGIGPGMRIADIGCGSGKTTYLLKKIAGPNGRAVGVDGSKQRIEYAGKHYGGLGIEYTCRDILESLEDLGQFDFVWIRFVLQYYLEKSFDIVRKISKILKPGGIICLIDQDSNCLCHYGFPERLGRTIQKLVQTMEFQLKFDPFVGRKLYTYLYDLGFRDIDVRLVSYNLIFGQLGDVEKFNWMKKLQMVGKNAEFNFDEYQGGFDEFYSEFKTCFEDPRRFFYTPLIQCRGINVDDTSTK